LIKEKKEENDETRFVEGTKNIHAKQAHWWRTPTRLEHIGRCQNLQFNFGTTQERWGWDLWFVMETWK
jgi:hypothetical protein